MFRSDRPVECTYRVQSGRRRQYAVYMARWINTRGEKGPWSDVTTATVAAELHRRE